MDATTVLAVISCAVVFCGWLVLPHRPTEVARPASQPDPAAVPARAS